MDVMDCFNAAERSQFPNDTIEFNFVSDAGTTQDIDVFGGFYVDDVSVSLD